MTDPWRPTQYTSEILGYTVTTFNFRSIKLLDWKGQEDTLLAQQNPFGWVVAAHLAAQQTRKSPASRLEAKLTLTRHLYEKGFNRDEILDFYTFLDRLLRLPAPLEIVYNEGIDQFEPEKQMQLITSRERLGIEKGLQQGLQQGERKKALSIARNMLAQGLDSSIIRLVTELTDEDLEGLH